MKSLIILILYSLFVTCGESQSQATQNEIGGPCEGCEAIYEYGNKFLNHMDTLPGFETQKTAIKLSGKVFKKDGKTPARDVIVYLYHTNDEGIYPSKTHSKGWERRHGYLRGWIKTNSNGDYVIYTSRPASYPNSTMPQHIHVIVKEPNKKEYYIEDYFFDDDPNLTSRIKNRQNPRGGSGVISLQGGQIKEGKRDIVLGLNVPDYY